MFVVDLHKSWLHHEFWRPRFLVDDQATIDRIRAQGIREVSIDTARGLDIVLREPGLPLAASPIPSFRERTSQKPATLSLGEERRRAARLLFEAHGTVQELMIAAQIGKT
ncbi:MAG TPA: DUF3391 domain-containing protein, partial [Rhodocyclaceae bacterium]|nr:DUF3391 domain-containing protein [Rhodocyclaceae bacterium]